MEPASLLLAALGCALIVEGLPYFVAPAGTRRAMRLLADQPESRLRLMGFLLMIGGLILVAFAVGVLR